MNMLPFLSSLADFMAWLSANQHVAYTILFGGSYFETLIGPGFFIPGEIFFLAGSILGGAGVLNIWVVSAVCFLGGILGDSSSYFIGKEIGTSIFKKDKKIFSLTNYKKGKKFFDDYGLKAIFFARLLGPLSWITPFFAGTYHVPYKKFFLYNVPGVIVGIGQFMIVGYFFGNQYEAVLSFVQRYVGITVLIILVFFISRWYIKAKWSHA